MHDAKYDAIIVGGRCAGAALAMRLARAGYRVLLLDRDEMPSDKPASTHLVWHAGVARLEAWGLLPRLLATGCPPVSDIRLDLGAFTLSGVAAPAGDIEYALCPRRLVLDAILLDAAIEAGAEFRQASVTDLLVEDGSVVGVRCADHRDGTIEERARIVVGADGANSTVAKLARAESANELPRLAGNIYAYFDNFPVGRLEFYARPGRMGYAFPTNDGLAVVGIGCRYDDYGRLAQSPDLVLAELQALHPEFDKRLREAVQRTPWRKAATSSFVRKPHGAGWALVGDAGMHVDAISAAGITNAFRDADLLADALQQAWGGELPLATALAEFERHRDTASMPIYAFTGEMAKLDPLPQASLDLFVAMRDNSEATRAYFGVFAQTVPVQEFFAPANLERIMAAPGAPALAAAG